MRPWKSRAGQIVIPAMLLFPTLFLFVYLIYETAKLSREKIKHQFAMDAAAFVEATNYSDFLNRTAYVNGAFPMRIFEQGYDEFPFDCKGDCSEFEKLRGKAYYDEVLFQNGVFPRSATHKKEFTDSDDVWDIEYGGLSSGRNSDPPDVKKQVMLFTHHNGDQSYHTWELASEVYRLYIQIFSLLGSVEDAQFQVLDRLTGTKAGKPHSFLRKSYYLNTGDSENYGDDLAGAFDSAMGGKFKTEAQCAEELVYHGNAFTPGAGLQQYDVRTTKPPVDLKKVSSPGCSGAGLFQMQTVDKDTLKALRAPGLSMSMKWQLPGKNYFNVDFGNMPQHFKNSAPELHTTVSVGGPNAKVWPHPTPKFQVRQYP